MNRFVSLLALLTAWGLAPSTPAKEVASQNTNRPPFEEIFELIQKNLEDLPPDELNRAAVDGLLSELDDRVTLVDSPDQATVEDGTEPEITIRRIAGKYPVIHISRIGPGVADQFMDAWNAVTTNRSAHGLVLDLRFASGRDNEAAAALAGRFTGSSDLAFEHNDRTIAVPASDPPITLPVAVLVNHETSGAAEVAAVLIRRLKAGLILGGTTAGQAEGFRHLKLSDGRYLRLSGQPVRFQDGSEISRDGVTPDLPVKVSLEDERLFLDDPYGENVATKTSRPSTRSRRITEADLVRQREEGVSLDEILQEPVDEDDVPEVVRDPALARAIDLLKGLSITESWKNR